MDSIVDHRFDADILSNRNEYFFSFLADRFEYATELWRKALEKQFKKKFVPIWILSAKQNELFLKPNYIIVNKTLKKLMKNIVRKNIIYLPDYEDLNKEFSESKFVSDLIDKLANKQGRVFVLGFTSSCLEISNKKVKLLGPDPKVAAKFDDKIEHMKLFKKLGVPMTNVRFYKSIRAIGMREQYPFFLSAAYTSGGHEAGIIYTKEDLDVFDSKLRDINRLKPFIVADFITDVALSPNVNALVYGKGKTEVVCISDQILRGHEYIGNVYPSVASEKAKKAIIDAAKVVGNYLSHLGFRGLFGLDFIIDSKDNVYACDLNPRRQGGYMCNVLMSKKIDIVQLELMLHLGKPLPKFSYKGFQPNFAWAHSKLKPYYKNMRIVSAYRYGDYSTPFSEIGSVFKCVFYSTGSLVIDGNCGYIILTGHNREDVKKRVIEESENIVSKDFELYAGFSAFMEQIRKISDKKDEVLLYPKEE